MRAGFPQGKPGSERSERNEQQLKDLHINCYDVEKD